MRECSMLADNLSTPNALVLDSNEYSEPEGEEDL